MTMCKKMTSCGIIFMASKQVVLPLNFDSQKKLKHLLQNINILRHNLREKH